MTSYNNEKVLFCKFRTNTLSQALPQMHLQISKAVQAFKSIVTDVTNLVAF